MFSFQLIFSYFFGLLLSLLLFYAIGKVLRVIWASSFSFQFFFADVFFSSLVGQIASVFFYAIYHTKGLTIQWLFLLIALFFWSEKKWIQRTDSPNFTFKNILPKLLTIFIGIVFCFLWEAYFFIDTNSFPFHIPFIDTGFYNNISHFLSVTGHENVLNMENWFEGQSSNGISLYHYFELWLNNLITNSSGLLSMPTYVLITQPSFFAIGFVGVLALLEQKAHFNFLHLFWAILLLFSGVVFFDFYLKIEKLQYIDIIFFHFLGHLSKKTGTYLVCMLAFALLFERKKYEQAYYTLLCLPIMTVTMFTSVIGGTWLFLFILFLSRNENRHIYKKILLSSILFFACFLIAYQFMRDDLGGIISINNIFSNLFSFNSLTQKMKLFIGTFAQVILLFFPYIIIILFNKPIKEWKGVYATHKEYIIAAVSLVVAGLISWVLFFSMNDSFQLFIGTLSALQMLIILLVLHHIHLFEWNNIRKSAANFLLALLFAYNLSLQVKKQYYGYSNAGNYFNQGATYSTSYLSKIKHRLHKINGFGACLVDNELVEHSPFPYKLSRHIIRLGNYLPLMTNECYVIQLYDFKPNELGSNETDMYMNLLSFYKFVKKQQKESVFQSIAQSQVDFIKKYKLKFLILSKNITLNVLFTPLIQEIIVDESSGERFIILKSNEN